jgi:hypothetical protein
MQLVAAITFGLVVWVVLWAVGVKSFDALLVTLAIVLLAGTARILAGYLRSPDPDA